MYACRPDSAYVFFTYPCIGMVMFPFRDAQISVPDYEVILNNASRSAHKLTLKENESGYFAASRKHVYLQKSKRSFRTYVHSGVKHLFTLLN